MALMDWVLLSAIAGYALFVLLRKKKKGCCGDCSQCSGCHQ
ncbi:MAG: FeoB-associated Cys-rich membrane protein [Ruminococcaceae bacterium]|nr:FeoB-associated Cys-rich membrane protein [Oscillospiraceae bacterium]